MTQETVSASIMGSPDISIAMPLESLNILWPAAKAAQGPAKMNISDMNKKRINTVITMVYAQILLHYVQRNGNANCETFGRQGFEKNSDKKLYESEQLVCGFEEQNS
jgi:hypothetical protein